MSQTIFFLVFFGLSLVLLLDRLDVDFGCLRRLERILSLLNVYPCLNFFFVKFLVLVRFFIEELWIWSLYYRLSSWVTGIRQRSKPLVNRGYEKITLQLCHQNCWFFSSCRQFCWIIYLFFLHWLRHQFFECLGPSLKVFHSWRPQEKHIKLPVDDGEWKFVDFWQLYLTLKIFLVPHT